MLPGRPWGAGFAAEYGGLRLAAWDEEGTVLPPERVLALVSLIELENGGGRVALPAGAPGGGAGAGRRTRRGGPGPGPGRFEAEEVYAALPWLRDGIFAAVRLCAVWARRGNGSPRWRGGSPNLWFSAGRCPLRRSPGRGHAGPG